MEGVKIAYKEVKVKLKENVSTSKFWEATYQSSSNLGIRLVHDFDTLKNNYLNGKLYTYGSLEVAIPMSYYNREDETIVSDIIEYGYIKDTKNIWDIFE